MKHVDKDSLKHFGINYILALIGGEYGVCVGVGASVTKEWFDKQSYGHWCWMDMIFDVLGMAAGMATHVLLKTLFFK